jgi:hypothetical protein
MSPTENQTEKEGPLLGPFFLDNFQANPSVPALYNGADHHHGETTHKQLEQSKGRNLLGDIKHGRCLLAFAERLLSV